MNAKNPDGDFRILVIDDNPAVEFSSASRQLPISVPPGKHRVRVSKGGQLVVDREVLVTDLQTMEIAVP